MVTIFLRWPRSIQSASFLQWLSFIIGSFISWTLKVPFYMERWKRKFIWINLQVLQFLEILDLFVGFFVLFMGWNNPTCLVCLLQFFLDTVWNDSMWSISLCFLPSFLHRSVHLSCALCWWHYDYWRRYRGYPTSKNLSFQNFPNKRPGSTHILLRHLSFQILIRHCNQPLQVYLRHSEWNWYA